MVMGKSSIIVIYVDRHDVATTNKNNNRSWTVPVPWGLQYCSLYSFVCRSEMSVQQLTINKMGSSRNLAIEKIYGTLEEPSVGSEAAKHKHIFSAQLEALSTLWKPFAKFKRVKYVSIYPISGECNFLNLINITLYLVIYIGGLIVVYIGLELPYILDKPFLLVSFSRPKTKKRPNNGLLNPCMPTS